jgi:hypothetical protein
MSRLLTSRVRFKVPEVSLMMDLEDSSLNEEDPERQWNHHSIKETNSSSPLGSIRGLQTAIAEGWLVQRARDMCSFAHDRYRQAAQADAETLPEDVMAKMRFRVRASSLPSFRVFTLFEDHFGPLA